jgi:hypothetical protein
MEPKGLLLCAQELTIRPYIERDDSSPCSTLSVSHDDISKHYFLCKDVNEIGKYTINFSFDGDK